MDRATKIRNFEVLIEEVGVLKTLPEKPKIIHCHGVFDLLHIGHIRYLEKAKRLGDKLVVTLTLDKHVNKGPHRPVFSENLRAEALAALDCVDYVATNQWPTAAQAITLLSPDVFAKGAEYQNNRTWELQEEERAITAAGGKLEFIEDLTSSSSYLINRHLDIFPEDVQQFLEEFRDKYSDRDILNRLGELQSLKALVVGEAIIDEYQYCDAIGKSSKEPALVAKYNNSEIFAGGALAVGNHVAGFADEVRLVASLGSENSHEVFIREHLKPNVDVDFLYLKGSPTIVKRRFVENYFLAKLFEIYVIDERELTELEEHQLCDQLNDQLCDCDLVIVSDFGHGMFTPKIVDLLCKKAPFLAVNTQINAGNKGFNTISKYPKADFISLNENEIRLEARNQRGNIKPLMTDLSSRLNAKRILITQGKYGSLCYDQQQGFCRAPALTTRVVDRVGAGDAVFSLTALCSALDLPTDVVAFLSNVAGAEAAKIIGNRSTLECESLSRHVGSLLK